MVFTSRHIGLHTSPGGSHGQSFVMARSTRPRSRRETSLSAVHERAAVSSVEGVRHCVNVASSQPLGIYAGLNAHLVGLGVAHYIWQVAVLDKGQADRAGLGG